MLILAGAVVCVLAIGVFAWVLLAQRTAAPNDVAPVVARPAARPALAPTPTAPRLQFDEDPEVTRVAPSAVRGRIDHAGDMTLPRVELKWVEQETIEDSPTGPTPLILVVASGQSDRGKKRRANEDRFVILQDHAVFAVADGMGGHEGGELASSLAIETLEQAFRAGTFTTKSNPSIPRGADELVRAVQMANAAVHSAAAAHVDMGTTLVSMRFALNKKRAYIAHVGDSRCYRLRGSVLRQLTTDHTMASMGAEGPVASLLSRAVGVDRKVPIDLLIEEPQANDLYLLCSDGLTKMVPDNDIARLIETGNSVEALAQKLVEEANARGGRDNVTVVLVRVQAP